MSTLLRWFRLTPGRLIIGLLPLEGLLLLSEHFRWFAFNEHKGWTVLVALGCVSLALVLMLLWFLAGLCFRWRFQYSLWSLLALIVVVAIPFSWLATEMHRARRQKAAAEAIVKAGGAAEYDYQLQFRGQVRLQEPAWLRSLLGNDFFSDVDTVGFWSSHIKDEWLENLDGLDNVQVLQLHGSSTHAGLEHLRRLHNLDFLELFDDEATDATLEHLEGLTNLRTLNLPGSRITDAGLKHLSGLTNLETLDLDGTKVTGTGLEDLKGAVDLESLDLGSTAVSDAGLEHISELGNLAVLDFFGTNLTDEGLKHLKGLKYLEWLSVSRTKVTDEGVMELQQSLPDCEIVH